jgi:hypothetical protein
VSRANFVNAAMQKMRVDESKTSPIAEKIALMDWMNFNISQSGELRVAARHGVT